jgi:rhodanese-related sulfurtransferase
VLARRLQTRLANAEFQSPFSTQFPTQISDIFMKIFTAAVLALSLIASVASAQENAAAPAPAAATAPQPWTHKTKQLDRRAVDALLANPKKVLFIDVRRPDEVVAKGSFPVFLNVQIDDLKNEFDFIPRDRAIVTISNRAHRAGDAGDQLAAKGFKVAGAIGTQDYEEQGGTIKRIVAPVKKTQ